MYFRMSAMRTTTASGEVIDVKMLFTRGMGVNSSQRYSRHGKLPLSKSLAVDAP